MAHPSITDVGDNRIRVTGTGADGEVGPDASDALWHEYHVVMAPTARVTDTTIDLNPAGSWNSFTTIGNDARVSNSHLGPGALVEPAANVVDSTIGASGKVYDGAVVSGSDLGEGALVGTEAHVENTTMGPHSEVSWQSAAGSDPGARTIIGQATRINSHARVGEGADIGDGLQVLDYHEVSAGAVARDQSALDAVTRLIELDA